jgi:hypothetical protein
MVEPDAASLECRSLLADLNALGVPLTAIVEHDLYPTPPDVPLPIATRTNRYYRDCGCAAADGRRESSCLRLNPLAAVLVRLVEGQVRPARPAGVVRKMRPPLRAK